ncbi:hypothetical protein [Streptomyces sp. enrichment culture]|uniref:hypothetical protein n=1 Tax=Streptomyces sp. enrichment culture TaxID=1795815 RepID=UPI003F545A45
MEHDFLEENEKFEEEEDEGTARVSVRAPLGTRLALKSVLEQHQVWAQRLQAHYKARLKSLSPAQRDHLLVEQHRGLHTLRRQGELLDTRDAPRIADAELPCVQGTLQVLKTGSHPGSFLREHAPACQWLDIAAVGNGTGQDARDDCGRSEPH